MALKSLLKPKSSITKFFLSSSILSSQFSSFCRKRIFSLPSESPPAAKKSPFSYSVHGVSLQDPYHWMSNTDDPDLADYLRRENSYAEAFMADTQILQRRLFSEMTSRIPAKVFTPPEPWGPWFALFSFFIELFYVSLVAFRNKGSYSCFHWVILFCLWFLLSLMIGYG